ncbi:hypothetical protein niasHT_028812 [Heterodera trifolii]|uniref:Uncharacterized protein n=1 Tax=Heterodera trifolii TaxID=157864 RepID=A0ABD2KQB5_9BILA
MSPFLNSSASSDAEGLPTVRPPPPTIGLGQNELVVSATLSRLVDVLGNSYMSPSLCSYVIMDEADKNA